jgi:polysaccharide export outer membrane protein
MSLRHPAAVPLLLAAALSVFGGGGCAGKRLPNISEAPASSLATPTPEHFVLGPGDRISIKVWRHDDLDMDVTIAPDGSITYPLVGRVPAAGMTYPELVDTLSASIADYYRDPQVSVNIIELKNQKVLVLGEVTNPSVLQLDSEMSILEALTMTGGINATSRTDNVLLIRGGLDKPELYTVDVRSIFVEGRTDQAIFLQRGDIVVVPTRTITNVGRYFKDIQTVLAPFVAGSAIYRNAISSGAQGTSSVLE